MRHRVRLAIALGLPLLLAASAPAARIDPALQEILDRTRNEDEAIPVLMVFPQSPDIENLELQLDLDGATPEKRRKSLIAALKRRARKAQTEAWEILEDPATPGELQSASMLYFANAIALVGDREVILAVAAAKSDELAEVVLFHDAELDLLAGVGGPLPGGAKAAAADTAWSIQAIGADRVWNEYGLTGEGILIGHVDTGVDVTHSDLKRRVRTNPDEIPGNGLDDDGNGLVDDVRGWDFGDGDALVLDDAANGGHGTHTAGTLVGDGSGGLHTGVAPGAQLVVAKVFTSDGVSSLGRLWAAQQYCAEQGARVISMSLGLQGEIPAEYLRNDRFSAEALRGAGVLLVNSAGNVGDAHDPPLALGMTARVPSPWTAPDTPPANTGGVITVGGTAYRSDESYEIGGRGPATWEDVAPWYDWPLHPEPGLIKPDLVAPAEGVQSTLPGSAYSGETWSGTSMAAPHVAGVAALMLQRNPTLSPAGIDSVLQQTARDLGAPGKDNTYGAGAVDALAAVAAVPMDHLPNLDAVTLDADPTGDGVLDPGETATLVFSARNAGVIPATGVVGALTVEASPWVTVVTDSIPFPDAPPGAETSNAGQPYELQIAADAPADGSFGLRLVLSTAEGFERVFDLTAELGLPQWRTLDRGSVYLTVTSRGSLGYLTGDRAEGRGMGMVGLPSALFTSSLWGGIGVSYLCNNDLDGVGSDGAEWIERLQPSGGVAIVDDGQGASGTQVFAAAFTDGGHAQPRGVTVELVAVASAETDLAGAVVLQYAIRNGGDDPLTGYRAGLFVDWDVVDALANVGAVDEAGRAVWVGHPDGPVFGQAILGDVPVSNLTLIDNVTYVFPHDHVLDAHKQQMLSGSISLANASVPTDLSALAAAGPFDLAPGEVVHVPFVVACGATPEAFLAAVAAAASGGSLTAVEPDAPEPLLIGPRLAQNHPNPFNPSTRIAFGLPSGGPVTVTVYDLAGRRVRELLRADLPAGDHSVRWDGRRDDGRPAAAGMYLYRLTAGGETLTRKAMLVK
jgi:subtilisin family serine protease